MRIVHESFRLMKVRRQHVEGTQRRQHAHIMGPVVPANVDVEPLMDQPGDGLECNAGDTSRRIGKRARKPAWQNPDRVGSEIDGVGNGRVVGDAAIDEHTSVDDDRREDSRDRRRRAHRVDGVAFRQQNLFAAAQLTGNHVKRNRGVFEISMPQVSFEECPETTIGDQVTSSPGEARKSDEWTGREHV